ncbi:MAG: FxLYD domain-containing protein [Zoogloeaceae bacterium]|jgi:hypothetical protein|nr:FxLYD domain-containing protein [Zoogloeaceae bacterium]
MDVRLKSIFLRALVLFAFLLASSAGGAQTCSDETLKSLAVDEVQTRFVKERGDTFVETIGILRNTGEEKVEDIRIATRHLDADGRLIGVQLDYLYGFPLAPGEDLAFRLIDVARHPQSAYASHVTRVAGADCAYNALAPASGKTPDATPSRWGKRLWDMLVQWGPILLLIVVLIIVTRKYSGARSPFVQVYERQFKLLERQIGLVERQLELSAQNNALFERIAKALEERNKS